ncbi:hypothetical protein HY500_02860 [Candidatus Woesearchaeota archaeon]|nr:hypothetical protein [Candidatus Woesearchaeota archaeon]
MGDKALLTPGGGLKIRWQGVTNFAEVYKFMKLWLEDRGFADEKTLEKKFTERRFAGGVKNLEIHWVCSRKESNYFYYDMEVTFLILGMSEVEIQVGDVKRKMDKGDVEIRVIASVRYGGDVWDKSSFIDRIYFNFIGRRRLEEHKVVYYTLLYQFVDYIKENLGLTR